MAMNQEIKEKWVAALRSGDYKQGKGALHHVEEGSFCCLGVLCDLASREGAAEIAQISEAFNFAYYRGSGDGPADTNSGVLPLGVADWAGLDSQSPRLPGGFHLTELNDGGKAFTEIADLIEQHL